MSFLSDLIGMFRIKAPTGEAAPGVLSIRDGQVNLYLVRCDDGYIAIDAGLSASHVQKLMQRLGVSPEQVLAVFITHSDRDHVGALELFSQAKVFVGRDETRILGDGKQRMMFNGRVKIRNHIAGDYTTLVDSESVEIGGVRIVCVATPGHTPGSSSYLVDNRLLFVGDAAALTGGKLVPFAPAIAMDAVAMQHSLARIAQVVDDSGVTHLFTGHHGWTAKLK